MLVAPLILATGCGRVWFDTTDPPSVSELAHRKLISIQSPVTTTLTGFPVSIVLAQDPDLATEVRADGGDVVFASLDDVVLASELVAIDAAAGNIEAWVQVPELVGGTTTSIYLYYGGPSFPRENPWSTTYAGVWHLDLVEGGARDSVGGQPADPLPTAPASVDAVVGGGAQFDGIDNGLHAGDPENGSLDFGTRSFGVSLWVRTDVPIAPYDTPLYKGGSSAASPGYDFELGTGPWDTYVSDGTTQLVRTVGSAAEFSGTWTQIAFVLDRANLDFRAFTNGSLRGNQTFVNLGSVDTDASLMFSRSFEGAQPYRGALDEIRIYGAAVSDDWIAAEYANLAARADMITIGPDEAL